MIDDPIVEEVRRVRASIFAECGGNLRKYMDHMRELAAKRADSPGDLGVSPPQKHELDIPPSDDGSETIHDPIVEEIHQLRGRIFDECGGDLTKYMKRLKEIAAENAARRADREENRQSRRTKADAADESAA